MDGPSKEELQNYWNSNRQHFDALAKYYETKDPKYYDEYIAPFYKGKVNTYAPVSYTSSGKSNSRKIVLLFAILILIFSGAGIYLLMLNKPFEKLDKVLAKPDKVIEKPDKVIENAGITIDSLLNNNTTNKEDFDYDSHFIKGLTYVSKKEYEKAEFHLKQVKENDPDYKSAKQILESIKYLKKYDKKEKE